MKTTLLLTTLATTTLAAGSATHSTGAATLPYATATGLSSGFVNANLDGSVGTNPENQNSRIRRGLAAFSVADLLANESITLGDLATTEFEFTFEASAGKTLSPGSYKVDFVGFFADANLPDSGTFGNPSSWFSIIGSSFGYTPTQTVDTLTADTSAAQTISATGFSLASATEADSNTVGSIDTVFFAVRYDEPQADGLFQDISGYSLALVPEPGSLALLGLGGLCLIKRRRRD